MLNEKQFDAIKAWMASVEERLFALEQRAKDQDAAEKLVMKEVMPSIVEFLQKVDPATGEAYQQLVDRAQAIAHRTFPLELHRVRGTCCPEPECDKIQHPVACPQCGAFCSECKRGLI